jgi:hypothetical protein
MLLQQFQAGSYGLGCTPGTTVSTSCTTCGHVRHLVMVPNYQLKSAKIWAFCCMNLRMRVLREWVTGRHLSAAAAVSFSLMELRTARIIAKCLGSSIFPNEYTAECMHGASGLRDASVVIAHMKQAARLSTSQPRSPNSFLLLRSHDLTPNDSI